MLSPADILSLTAEQQEMADLFEAHIDEAIKTASDADPILREFAIDTAAFSKAHKDDGGLSIKVRVHVEEQFVDAGWKCKMDEKGRILTVKCPRKYKARKPAPEAPEAPEAKDGEKPEGEAAAA